MPYAQNDSSSTIIRPRCARGENSRDERRDDGQLAAEPEPGDDARRKQRLERRREGGEHRTDREQDQRRLEDEAASVAVGQAARDRGAEEHADEAGARDEADLRGRERELAG